MINLPPSAKKIFSLLKIPRDLRKHPDHPLVSLIVFMTKDYRDLINEFEKPETWAKFKKFVSEKISALNIGNYFEFYEKPNNLLGALSNTAKTVFQDDLLMLAKDGGYEDIVFEKIDKVDETRLAELFNHVFRMLVDFHKEFDLDEFNNIANKESTHEFEGLPDTKKVELIKAVQYMACHILICVYNAISIMTNRQSMFTLVKKAQSGTGGSDEAICLAVRIDNNLRQHPKFLERYNKATIEGDQVFLRKYHLTSSPITNKINYPGVYFLLSLLDSFGVLSLLTNNQVLCLCEHAGLYSSECVNLDTKGLAKIRNEFLKLNCL